MQAGELFAERYTLLRECGRGGMGVVWQARDERLGRSVALKTISPSLSHDPVFRRRFEKEATAVARVQHPNVVTLYDRSEADGVLYAVMAFVPGRDLREELADGPLDLDRAVRLVGGVAAGLDAAADVGVLHRDVKPANVLLAADGQPERAMLTDFGIASLSDGTTEAGQLQGTPGWVAPERWSGSPATRVSDVWSLARLAVACLTGPLPSEGALPWDAVPAPLRAPLQRALSPDPAERPRTAGELAAELRVAAARVRQDERTTVLPAPAPEPPSAVTVPVAPVADAVTTRPVPLAPTAAPPLPPDPTPAHDVAPAAAAPRRGRRLLLPAAVAVVLAAAATLGWAQAGGDDVSGVDRAPRQALEARLPDEVYASCTPRPEGEGDDRPASLLCTPAQPGADELLVTQWQDPAAMDEDWQTAYVGAPRRYREAPCGDFTGGPPRTGRRSTWESPSGPAPLACYVNDPGAAVLLWEYPEDALQVRAVRKDGDAQALFRWWQRANGVALLPAPPDA